MLTVIKKDKKIAKKLKKTQMKKQVKKFIKYKQNSVEDSKSK